MSIHFKDITALAMGIALAGNIASASSATTGIGATTTPPGVAGAPATGNNTQTLSTTTTTNNSVQNGTVVGGSAAANHNMPGSGDSAASNHDMPGGTATTNNNANATVTPNTNAGATTTTTTTTRPTPTLMNEEQYWRNKYPTRPYYNSNTNYTVFEPAYQYGVTAYGQYGGKTYQELDETKLRADWERANPNSPLRWDQAQPAVRDAYERVYNNSHANGSATVTR